MSGTSRAIKGAVTSFLQYGLQIVLQIALAPLVLRAAGQETLGAYVSLMQAIGYLALVDFGFTVPGMWKTRSKGVKTPCAGTRTAASGLRPTKPGCKWGFWAIIFCI